MRAIACVSWVLLVAMATMAAAQERQTEHTLKAAPGAAPPSATIAEMAWFAGTWRGQGLGGEVEEVWTAPREGIMLGAFRMLKGGHPAFYELMTLGEENGSLMLRVKHFDPDLTGWEDRDKNVAFPLVAKRDGVVYFEGVTFAPGKDGTATIYLSMKQKDGTSREEVLRYVRVESR